MITTHINDLYYSFCLFIDHQIQQKGEAFTNHSSSFYKMEDKSLSNYTVYASPFKQFVYDYSISGANIPSGVYINNVFCNKGVSGLKIDYLNGRVILSGGAAYKNLNISGSYAVKDFNIYPTTQSDEELIFETKYELRPKYTKALSGIDKSALTVPGIFIVNLNTSLEPYSFGGLCETTINIHSVILSDSKDQLDAVGSLIVDEKYSSFPVFSKTPLNPFGDFKSGNYNYLSYISGVEMLGYISDVDFYKLSSKDFSDRYPDLKAGFCDIQVKLVRQPNRSIY